MATSPQSKVFTLLLLAIAASICHAEDACAAFNSTYIITEWNNPPPASVLVYQYHKREPSPIKNSSALTYKATVSQGKDGKNYLVISPAAILPRKPDIHKNYLIEIDSNTHYIVSDIKSSNLPHAGCPIDSAKINQCTAPPGDFVTFSSTCH